MVDLHFPFWIVTDKHLEGSQPEHVPCDLPTAAHTFTSPAKLIAYLGKRQRGSFTIHLVADYLSFVTSVADIHDQEIKSLCVDPEPDGSNGHPISVAEAMSKLTST